MNIEIIRNEEQFLLHLITKLWSTQTLKVVYMVVMGGHLLFIVSLLSCLLVNVCFATKQMIILSVFFFRNVCGSGGQEQLSVYRGGATLGRQDELAVVCGHSEQ